MMENIMVENTIAKTVEQMKKSQRALILTGAGMSADSGIPTYRDKEGLWREFPLFKKLSIQPQSLATPYAFDVHTERAWAFIEWKRRKAQENEPHQGYTIINNWCHRIFSEMFVQTMNVDGYHLRSGWHKELLLEVHGSIWRIQCSNKICKRPVTENNKVPFIDFDKDTMKASDIPKCEVCKKTLRPNVLLFGDYQYHQDGIQNENLVVFIKKPVDIIFIIGCSSEVPTNDVIAATCKKEYQSTLVAINPVLSRSSFIKPDIHIPLGAYDALSRINTSL